MSALVTIKGRLRNDDEKGKNACRQLRRAGHIPANILSKPKSVPIAIEPKLLSLAWKSGKAFQLDLDGQVKAVAIKELQIDPISRNPLHVDLIFT